MRARTSGLFLFCLLILTAASATYAGDNFFTNGPDGWLWYRDPALQEPAAPAPSTPAAPTTSPRASQPALPPYSVAWLRAWLPRLRDLAINDPSYENVRAYLVAQKLAMDKAQRFAEVAMMVTRGDGQLDENTRYPTATAAIRQTNSRARQGTTDAIAQLAKGAGLFFFFRSDCPYCHADLPVLRTLQLTTGMKVLAISLDGAGIDDSQFPHWVIDNGQAEQLGVSATPAFFLVRPGAKSDVIPIGQGYLALDELESRIVDQSYYRGWLSRTAYEAAHATPSLLGIETTAGISSAVDAKDRATIDAVIKQLPPLTEAQIQAAITGPQSTPTSRTAAE